jgi:hypothetical protein
VGKFFSVETPPPPGPRHCGQFVSSPEAVTSRARELDRASKQTIKIKPRLKEIRFIVVTVLKAH